MNEKPSTKLSHEWCSPGGKKLSLEILEDKIIFYSKFNNKSDEYAMHYIVDSEGVGTGGLPISVSKINTLKKYIKDNDITLSQLPDFVKKIVVDMRFSKKEMEIS